MSAAVQVYYTAFDADFFKFSSDLQERIQAKIDEMGLGLKLSAVG